MLFLYIIAPVPVIALNALESPVNAFMAKRPPAALRSSGLQLSIWGGILHQCNAQCTPHKYIVTQRKSWKAEKHDLGWVQCVVIALSPMHLETSSSWKKLSLQSWSIYDGHLFFEAPTSTQFVLFPCYASNKLTRNKFLSDPSPIIGYACHSLTHSLTAV